MYIYYFLLLEYIGEIQKNRKGRFFLKSVMWSGTFAPALLQRYL